MRLELDSRLFKTGTSALLATLLALTAVFLSSFLLGVAIGSRPVALQSGEDRQLSPRRSTTLSAFLNPFRWIDAAADPPEIVVKGAPGTGWSDLLEAPDATSRRISQALIGDRIQVLERRQGWIRANLPGSEVSGWLPASHVSALGPRERELWKKSKMQIVVKAPGTRTRSGFFLPFAAGLPAIKTDAETVHLLSPGGGILAVDARHVRSIDRLPTLAETLEEAKRFQGVSFEFGANTIQAMDAPGLVYLIYRAAGVPVARNVQQQIGEGQGIDPPKLSPGDVVFLETFDPAAPRPVVVLDKSGVYIGASPAQGTGFGLLQQDRNRRVLSIRRYVF